MLTKTTPAAYPQVTALIIPKADIVKTDFALGYQPAETLEHFYVRQSSPTIVINGGFFDMSNGETVLTYRADGEDISTYTSHRVGIGLINDELTFGELNKSYTDFVCGHPVLISDYKPTDTSSAANLDYNARRSVLGYNKQNVIILLVDDPGLRFKSLQNILQNYGVQYAINLDGGGSTRCLLYGKLITQNIYSRPVDNFIAFYLKSTVHRVQVGAFAQRSNAETYRNTIAALPDPLSAGYTDAYVRYVSPWYKVQIGAYSVLANAQKVLKDLQSKNIPAFINSETE